jgi:hypothetical protein
MDTVDGFMFPDVDVVTYWYSTSTCGAIIESSLGITIWGTDK